MNKDKYSFERHEFKIVDRHDKTCQIIFDSNEGNAFKKERRKLYVIHKEKEIFYVGEANSSIKIRFQRACSSYNHFSRTAKARGGYKGYKWLDKNNNKARSLTLTIAIFNSTYDCDAKRKFIEAVEGEIVYLVRNELDYWPKYQNEIHFQNEFGAKEIAMEIFKSINCLSVADKMKKSIT